MSKPFLNIEWILEFDMKANKFKANGAVTHSVNWVKYLGKVFAETHNDHWINWKTWVCTILASFQAN